MSGSMDARRRFEPMRRLIADQSFPAVSNDIFSASCSVGVTRPIAPGNGSDSLAPLRIWTVPGALWGHLLWALRF